MTDTDTDIDRQDLADKAVAILDPEDWYESYGWHVSTERAGDVGLQVVGYTDLDEADDDRLVDRLVEDGDLTRCEARRLVAKARTVRAASESICSTLEEAIEAYRAGDDALTQELLGDASREEYQHGDDPATTLVADVLDIAIR